jgi:hypothetical protein
MPGERRGAGRWRWLKLDDGKNPGLVPVWLDLTGEAEAPARRYAELSFRARQMLMAFIMEVVENLVGPLPLYTGRDNEACPLS